MNVTGYIREVYFRDTTPEERLEYNMLLRLVRHENNVKISVLIEDYYSMEVTDISTHDFLSSDKRNYDMLNRKVASLIIDKMLVKLRERRKMYDYRPGIRKETDVLQNADATGKNRA